MSQEAVERRRKILGIAAGVGLTLIGIHHVKAVIGTAAKAWLSVGYGLTGAAIGRGTGAFSKGFRAGTTIASASVAFRAGYQATVRTTGPTFSVGLNEYGRAAANAIQRNGANISRSIGNAPPGFFFLK